MLTALAPQVARSWFWNFDGSAPGPSRQPCAEVKSQRGGEPVCFPWLVSSWQALGSGGWGDQDTPDFLLRVTPAGLLATGGCHRDGAGASDSREPSLTLFPSSDFTVKRRESDGRRKMQRRRKSRAEEEVDVRLAGHGRHGSFSIQLEVLPLLAGRRPAARQAGLRRDARRDRAPAQGGERPHCSGRDTGAQRGQTDRSASKRA